MTRFAILLFFFFLIHHPLTTTAKAKDKADPNPFKEEYEALLRFKKKVQGDHPKYLWNDTVHVCNWTGVTCYQDRVDSLRMPAARLVGEIPAGTIGNLSYLRVLSLHTNNLSGTIPEDFSKLKLRKLYLHNNSITGMLPNLKLDELRVFDVSLNNFTGPLPYMKWDKITKFNVSNNSFTCPIPASLSKFPESQFTGNTGLCGGPLINVTCKNDTACPSPENDHKSKSRLIVGVSIGSGLLLLFLLCCLGNRMTKHKKQTQDLESASQAQAQAQAASTSTELVFLDAGIYNFDMEDLYQASTELLGKGSVGTSHKAVMNLNGGTTTVVVKRLKNVVVTKEEFESRMEVLGKMKNQHLIPLKAYYYSKDKNNTWLVYDYMPAGSLSAKLHNGSRGFDQTRLDWKQRMRIALSAARGVEYLHVVGKVVHGNIKSSNILLRQETNKDACVSDYGLNTLFDVLSSKNHRVMGYQAPEVLKTGEVTFVSDVYSFGVLLLELLTGKDPNQTSLDKEGIEFSMWVQSITHEEPKAEVLDVELRRHQDIEEKMVQLLQIAKECVLFEPDRRPTMNKVVRMMEDMNRVEMDDWLRQSFDDHSKPFDDTPSTQTLDTPTTITP